MVTYKNKELKLVDKAAYDFARKVLKPGREEYDAFPYGPFFEDVLDKAYNLDFFHTILPETYGGIGHTISSLCVILDNLCREDSSLGGIIMTNTAAYEIFLAAESSELLKRMKTLIAFPIFINPNQTGAGLEAEKINDKYIITGTLEYLVLGGMVKHAIVPAKIKDCQGYSFFLIDLLQKGFTKSEPIHSLGLHACPAVDTTLNKVEGELIGKEGSGDLYFKIMTDKLYVAAAAMSAGVMKGSFKEALDYGKNRKQGGRRIIDWSEVKMILANMSIKIKNADMIISRAIQAIEHQEQGWKLCSQAAALHIQEMAANVTTDGVQLLGGVGYMKDFGQEKRFRDAKQLQALFGITPLKKIKYIEEVF